MQEGIDESQRGLVPTGDLYRVRDERRNDRRSAVRLVLSRKGFDSAAGGGPSPILPNGRMVSLPIPEPSTVPGAGLSYDAIDAVDGLTMADVIQQLGCRRTDPSRGAHLDPDLDAAARARAPGWRATFGQSHAAQTHLDNRGVDVGDVFVFFGLFRRTARIGGRLRWATNAPRVHAAFGWMQVGERHRVTDRLDLPWAAEHPPLRDRNRLNNTLYVATDRLSFAPELPGSGLLPFSSTGCLTAAGATTTSWRLPDCFAPRDNFATLSYHERADRWSESSGGSVSLRAVARGQEFVTDLDDRVRDEWLLPLLRTAVPRGAEAHRVSA